MRLRSKFVLALSFLLLSIITIRAQECTCAKTFEKVVQVYEHDYALFPIKVTQTNKELYTANKEVFRQKAARVTTIEACLPILQQW